MLDASAQLSFVDALQIGSLLDELHFEWFEEPLPDRHILQLKKLCERVKTPILAGETVSLFEMPQYLAEGAVDVMRADTHIKRGITGLMKALAVCELMGYELEIHTASSPLLDVANLQVACATHLSNFVENHHSMFRFGLKGNPLDVQPDGCQHLPSGPGLGVEIDWDWMDNNTTEVIKGCRY
jgi:L-alanine-DL-glutamate epimerase-like enolase superfamily enzyme